MTDLIHTIHAAYYKLSRVDTASKPEMKLSITQTMKILSEAIDEYNNLSLYGRLISEEKVYDDENPNYIAGTEDGI